VPPRQGRPTKSRSLYLAKDPFLRVLQEACHLAHDARELKKSERERQVEDTFFRAAVSLEAFLSDWLARSLSFDTSRLAAATRQDLLNHLSGQAHGAWAPENAVYREALKLYTPTAVQANVSIPRSVAANRARELLGVRDSNRSFSGAAEFKEWVGRYIADSKSKQNASELNAGDDAVLDATLAIRNVLAHRSPRAQARLRATLGSQDLPAALRSQTVTAGRVGRYLQAEQQGHPRFQHYFQRLATMAAKLAPYVGRPRAICPTP
jgi:hypothetical protein